MKRKTLTLILSVLAALAAAALYAQVGRVEAADGRIFELRKYTTNPGKLDALNRRFREHTNAIFVKHGMQLIGFWTPSEGAAAENTLVYMLAYPSKAARDASWKAFREDPEWKRAAEESNRDGKIVRKVEATFLSPTDYSPIQ